MTKTSKAVKDVTYETHVVAGRLRYLTIKYKELILYRGTSYPVKVSKVTADVESYIGRFADLMARAYSKIDGAQTESMDLFFKLSKSFQENRI